MVRNRLDLAAIIQNDGRFAIAPHYSAGLLSPADLRRLAEVAERFGAQAIKLSSAGRPILVGIEESRLEEAWEALGTPRGAAIGLCLRSIKCCPGARFCPYGQQDTIALCQALESRFQGRPLPNKFKIGVSGCPHQCAENAIKDLAFQGTANGYRVQIGGNGGAAPRLSQRLCEVENLEAAVQLTGRILDLFAAEGPKMRIGKWIEKLGLDAFKEKLAL